MEREMKGGWGGEIRLGWQASNIFSFLLGKLTIRIKFSDKSWAAIFPHDWNANSTRCRVSSLEILWERTEQARLRGVPSGRRGCWLKSSKSGDGQSQQGSSSGLSSKLEVIGQHRNNSKINITAQPPLWSPREKREKGLLDASLRSLHETKERWKIEFQTERTYHSLSTFDFLKYSFNIKITKLCPGSCRQLHSTGREQLGRRRDRRLQKQSWSLAETNTRGNSQSRRLDWGKGSRGEACQEAEIQRQETRRYARLEDLLGPTVRRWRPRVQKVCWLPDQTSSLHLHTTLSHILKPHFFDELES